VKAPAFAYVKPASLAETFELLECHREDAKILAGGQSLIAALNMRLAAPRVLIDIGGLSEFAGINVMERMLTIGALTRHRDIERAPEIARHLPLLHQALPHVAHAAIRNRGTFGGSIAFADPAAELPACSLALDAKFLVANKERTRRVAAREFFKGLYETALEPGEILLAGEFPVLEAGYRSAFQELARRHGDYAIVGLAAHGRFENGMLSGLRLAYFGVGATPVLARNAAAAFEGRAFSVAAVEAAQAALERDLDPYDDVHYSAAARMHLARVLTGRVVAQLAREER
jgi:carbon-monoxide dehydrogenase medium subunit